MKIIEVKRIETSDENVQVNIENFEGQQFKKIHAFLINEGAHGYGKFVLPVFTLEAFFDSFHKIESSLNRKMLMNMMYDQIKSGKTEADRILIIIMRSLQYETSVDVMEIAYRKILKNILNRYIHKEIRKERTRLLFHLTLSIMQSGRFNSNAAAMQLLVEGAIEFSAAWMESKLILLWFE